MSWRSVYNKLKGVFIMSMVDTYSRFGKMDLYERRQAWVKKNFSRIQKVDGKYFLNGDRRMMLLKVDVEIYESIRRQKGFFDSDDDDGGNVSTGLSPEAEADDGLEL